MAAVESQEGAKSLGRNEPLNVVPVSLKSSRITAWNNESTRTFRNTRQPVKPLSKAFGGVRHLKTGADVIEYYVRPNR